MRGFELVFFCSVQLQVNCECNTSARGTPSNPANCPNRQLCMYYFGSYEPLGMLYKSGGLKIKAFAANCSSWSLLLTRPWLVFRAGAKLGNPGGIFRTPQGTWLQQELMEKKSTTYQPSSPEGSALTSCPSCDHGEPSRGRPAPGGACPPISSQCS